MKWKAYGSKKTYTVRQRAKLQSKVDGFKWQNHPQNTGGAGGLVKDDLKSARFINI